MRQMGGMRSMRRLGGLGGRAAPAIVGQGENFEFWIVNWAQAASLRQRGKKRLPTMIKKEIKGYLIIKGNGKIIVVIKNEYIEITYSV